MSDSKIFKIYLIFDMHHRIKKTWLDTLGPSGTGHSFANERFSVSIEEVL